MGTDGACCLPALTPSWAVMGCLALGQAGALSAIQGHGPAGAGERVWRGLSPGQSGASSAQALQAPGWGQAYTAAHCLQSTLSHSSGPLSLGLCPPLGPTALPQGRGGGPPPRGWGPP